jgi:hypothetical protein
MRTAPASIRFAIAALFALLALRSLAPAGFMPAFDHGAVTIVACPDASPAMAGMRHHGSTDHDFAHHPCPYASAASLGALGPDWAPLLVLPFFATVLLLGRTFLFVERQTARERPPSRGPPIPA